VTLRWRAAVAVSAIALVALPAAASEIASAEPAEVDEAAEAAREQLVERLGERWDDAFRSWLERAEALPKAEGALVSAGRRDVDATEDLAGLQETLTTVHAEVTAAVERLESAQERAAEAEHEVELAAAELERAEDAVTAQRLAMDAHAASIYKYGATQLGAIESILRSGSPTDYLAHLKLRESVLSYDHHRYLEFAAERDVAAELLLEAVERLDVAVGRVERRADELAEVEEVADAVAETIRVQQRTVRSAADTHRARAASVADLESRVSARVSQMVELEERLAEAAAEELAALVDRRRQEQERLAEERAESFPFLDRTRFRRPLLFPAPTGFTCPVEGAQFINDWAFPRPGGRTHEGTDMFAPIGTPVLAVADGEVIRLNREDRYDGGLRRGLGGRTVHIATSESERWYFAHLEVIDPGLSVGDEVVAGQQIGTVGDSGNARGGPPHLHIGRYIDDIGVNPWPAMHIACLDED
jgi:murein DD-endopeptidase MepM/ murein hydrolase activator NlpD